MGDFDIKRLREQAGLSQAELAERVGVKTRTLGSWERGEREPDLMTAWMLADAMDCTIDELAGRPKPTGVEGYEFGDPHFERIERAYSELNRDSQMLLAEFAESFACDPRRRK